MQTPLKQTVMFADQVSTLGSTVSTAPLSPPAPSCRISKAAHDKRGYLNGLLIGLMGIVFGLGIMYLLSRLMQTTRKLAVVERQLKQNQLVVEDIGLQMEFMRHQPAPAPRAVELPPPKSAPAPSGSAKPTLVPPRGVPIPSPAALFDLALPMSNLPMFFEVVMDAPDAKLATVEEVEEEEGGEVEKDSSSSAPDEAGNGIEEEEEDDAGDDGVHAVSPPMASAPSDGDAEAGADAERSDKGEEAESEPAKRGRRKGTTAQSRQRKK